MKKLTAIRSLCLVAALAAPMMGQGIYTTTALGNTVNGNLYANKSDVYLTGGPNNCNGPGLPDGTYYFEVTDPAGSVLLSSDVLANRVVSASGGFVTGYSGPHVFNSVQKCPIPAALNSLVQLMPYDNTPNNGGEYKVTLMATGCATEDSVTHLLSGSNGCFKKTDNFKIKEIPCDPMDPMCSPGDFGEITGLKFYDLNANGTQDNGEPPIPGWKVTNSDFTTAFTDAAGIYHFNGLPNTQYTITEIFPNATWLPTTPPSGGVLTDQTGTGAGPNFGNVCLGAGGGLTLGFWSNKNGQALVGNDDLAMLAALNLRNASGANFDPAPGGYAAFRTWILGATATNMAYMLSAQLAAMELNVYNGKVNGGSLIYAPGTTSANAFGFATVNAVMAEANTELGLHGTATAGNPWRAYQEAIKNALDAANNNKTFVQPGICPFTYPAEV